MIRLRGGWEIAIPTDRASRVTLPWDWPRDLQDRVTLRRRFQTPPLEPGSERLVLAIEQVPGLRLVTLNGTSLADAFPDRGRAEFPLPAGLPDRNVLDFHVDGDRAGEDPGEWGTVALLVRGD